jgi:hypothetical protein
MEQLIQDIPPETSSWPHPRTWLLDSVSAISELRFAIACGQLGPVVTPSQFLAWCERHVVDLHFAFCQRVKTLNAPPVTAVPMGPAWAPLGGMAAKVMTRKRGRPKVAIGNDASLIKAAHDLLMSHAVTGRALTRDEVASALHGSESAGTLSAASIRRRLSGKLNLEYTKALATQVK